MRRRYPAAALFLGLTLAFALFSGEERAAFGPDFLGRGVVGPAGEGAGPGERVASIDRSAVGLSAVRAGDPWIPGEILLGLEPGTNSRDVARGLGLRVIWEGAYAPVAVLQADSGEAARRAMAALRTAPGVRYARPHGWVQAADTGEGGPTPEDTGGLVPIEEPDTGPITMESWIDDPWSEDHSVWVSLPSGEGEEGVGGSIIPDDVVFVPNPTVPSLESFQDQLRPIHAPVHADRSIGLVSVAVLDSGIHYENSFFSWFDGLSVGFDPSVDTETDVVSAWERRLRDGDYPSLRSLRLMDLHQSATITSFDAIEQDMVAVDENQHGSHIATLIGGMGPIWGVAPGVSIWPVRVLDGNRRGTEAWLLDALYAMQRTHPDVINMSLTFRPGYLPSPDLVDVLDALHQDGIVMVGAAGNDGIAEVGWPAAHPEVIAVGAVCLEAPNLWRMAPYSNFGGGLDIVAPGGCLDRDIDADGSPDGVLGESIAPQDPTRVGYWLMAGTSQATALVSGAAAVALYQGVEPADMRYVLGATSQDYALKSWKKGQGRGMLDLLRLGQGTMPVLAPDWVGEEVLVGMLPSLRQKRSGDVAPVVQLTARYPDGRLATGLALVGSFRTVDGVGEVFSCRLTEANPICEVEGAAVSPDQALVYRVQVDGAWKGRYRLPTRGVVWASADLLGALDALKEQAAGEMVFGWHFAAGRDDIGEHAESFVFTTAGSGISTSPFGVVLNRLAAEGLGEVWQSTVDLQLGDVDGSGISTSPFGLTTLLLSDGTRLALLDGSGISTSPFGARVVQLSGELVCAGCMAEVAVSPALESTIGTDSAGLGGSALSMAGWDLGGSSSGAALVGASAGETLGVSSGEAVEASTRLVLEFIPPESE